MNILDELKSIKYDGGRERITHLHVPRFGCRLVAGRVLRVVRDRVFTDLCRINLRRLRGGKRQCAFKSVCIKIIIDDGAGIVVGTRVVPRACLPGASLVRLACARVKIPQQLDPSLSGSSLETHTAFHYGCPCQRSTVSGNGVVSCLYTVALVNAGVSVALPLQSSATFAPQKSTVMTGRVLSEIVITFRRDAVGLTTRAVLEGIIADMEPDHKDEGLCVIDVVNSLLAHARSA